MTTTRSRTRRSPRPGAEGSNSGLEVRGQSTGSAPETQPTGRCPSCGGTGKRLIRSYWGPFLCPECVAEVAVERDADGAWPVPWWEHEVPGHILVLGDGCAWHRNKAFSFVPTSLRELGGACERMGITQVWVHASALDSLGFPASTADATREGAAHPFTSDHGPWSGSGGRWCGLRPWAYWYKRGGHGFDFHIPAYGRAVWQACESAPELAARVAMFDKATGGVPWKGNGTITSDAFLRRRLSKGLAPTELCPPMDRDAHEVAIRWTRAARPDEEGLLYCHGLDLNLAYASAASSLPLPTGAHVHLEWPAFDKTLAGVYLIDDDAKGRWVTAPTMERLDARGVHALEAYVWPDSARHLRPWYEMIRDARAALLENGGPALDALKSVCREGLGRMQSKTRTIPPGKSLAEDPTYQPYWAWAVIAETRERLMAKVAALSMEPVGIDTDCLYFLTDRTSPAELAVHLRLPMGDGLGQFKAAGTCLGSVAREILGVQRPDSALKALGEAMKG